MLETVGSKFTDTRPVIVFEDFAITAMEAKQLRNYMERDKYTDNWDFIVAGTRDPTEVLHRRTAEVRFEFFQTNERGSSRVLFLDEETAVDFVAPYLGYIKSHDGSVRYEEHGDGTLALRSAPPGSICAECGFCDGSFRDLFPFNEAFLQRLFAGLDESEQSPREYVMTTFDVLEAYYEGYARAPSSADVLQSLRNTVAAADEVYEQAEAFADLAKWYGDPRDDDIIVDRRFADVFGLTDGVVPEPIELTEDEV